MPAKAHRSGGVGDFVGAGVGEFVGGVGDFVCAGVGEFVAVALHRHLSEAVQLYGDAKAPPS